MRVRLLSVLVVIVALCACATDAVIEFPSNISEMPTVDASYYDNPMPYSPQSANHPAAKIVESIYRTFENGVFIEKSTNVYLLRECFATLNMSAYRRRSYTRSSIVPWEPRPHTRIPRTVVSTCRLSLSGYGDSGSRMSIVFGNGKSLRCSLGRKVRRLLKLDPK